MSDKEMVFDDEPTEQTFDQAVEGCLALIEACRTGKRSLTAISESESIMVAIALGQPETMTEYWVDKPRERQLSRLVDSQRKAIVLYSTAAVTNTGK